MREILTRWDHAISDLRVTSAQLPLRALGWPCFDAGLAAPDRDSDGATLLRKWRANPARHDRRRLRCRQRGDAWNRPYPCQTRRKRRRPCRRDGHTVSARVRNGQYRRAAARKEISSHTGLQDHGRSRRRHRPPSPRGRISSSDCLGNAIGAGGGERRDAKSRLFPSRADDPSKITDMRGSMRGTCYLLVIADQDASKGGNR